MVAMYVEYNEIKRRKENENGIEEGWVYILVEVTMKERCVCECVCERGAVRTLAGFCEAENSVACWLLRGYVIPISPLRSEITPNMDHFEGRVGEQVVIGSFSPSVLRMMLYPEI